MLEKKSREDIKSQKEQLVEVGIPEINIKELDIKGMKPEALEKELGDKNVIFIGFGDAFYLLKYARESGFDRILKKLSAQGKFIVGISAGSYILGPNIEQATWKSHADSNWVGLADLTAADLMPEKRFLLSAHFEEKLREYLTNGAKTTEYPVVAIKKTQAVLIEGNRIRVIGEKAEDDQFFNGFERLLQGSEV